MNTLSADDLLARYRKAVERRARWESLWRDCYAYALPQREHTPQTSGTVASQTTALFDGTAPDAVDQLAASLLGELTPPWGEWFALIAGAEASPDASLDAGPALERVNTIIRRHFEHSNFAIEMHQCFLDLVTVGSACLMFEESPVGEPSAFHFTAVPLNQVTFEESPGGRLDTTYRRLELDHRALLARFPDALIPEHDASSKKQSSGRGEPEKIAVIETVMPKITVIDTQPLWNRARATIPARGYWPREFSLNRLLLTSGG